MNAYFHKQLTPVKVSHRYIQNLYANLAAAALAKIWTILAMLSALTFCHHSLFFVLQIYRRGSKDCYLACLIYVWTEEWGSLKEKLDVWFYTTNYDVPYRNCRIENYGKRNFQKIWKKEQLL